MRVRAKIDRQLMLGSKFAHCKVSSMSGRMKIKCPIEIYVGEEGKEYDFELSFYTTDKIVGDKKYITQHVVAERMVVVNK